MSVYSQAFETSVGKTKPMSYFEYNQRVNHLDSPVRFGVVKDDQLVGSHTIRPLLLNIDGHGVKSGLTMDSFIHPEHRKKGLFTRLVTATTEAAKDRGWMVILGFANRNSIDIYKRQLGHVEPGTLQYYSMQKFQQLGQAQSFDVEEHQLPGATEAILQQDKSSEGFRVSVRKDLPYLEWRYMQSPESRYQVLSHGKEFLCILKQYEDELQIVDFFYTDKSCLPRLLASCMEYACSNGKLLSFWLSSAHPLYEHFKGLKYKTLDAPQHLHVLAKDPKYSGALGKLKNWHYVMGDSDVF